ncbi:hypothetical protein KAR91_47025 [Candidatus Pacearchaeota archaeon]|nr:hypothetical protein [Candidatus Pacearchaeota archaeon]
MLLNELWYYVFLIADDNHVDIGIDMNLDAENIRLISGLKYYRRIGQFQWLSDRIRPFFMNEDTYMWHAPEVDEN